METNLLVAGFGGQGVMTLGKSLRQQHVIPQTKSLHSSRHTVLNSVVVRQTVMLLFPMIWWERRWAMRWMT